jgi:hypothetical protein
MVFDTDLVFGFVLGLVLRTIYTIPDRYAKYRNLSDATTSES